MPVSLRPMSEAEIDAWYDAALESYIASRTRNGEPADVARRVAEQQHADYFPDRRPAPGHELLVVEDDGRQVGMIWTAPHQRRPDDANVAFIYNIEIDESRRGRGVGRVALALIEARLVAAGVTRIELNVFGDNRRARHIYVSSGYHETSVQMAKELKVE